MNPFRKVLPLTGHRRNSYVIQLLCAVLADKFDMSPDAVLLDDPKQEVLRRLWHYHDLPGFGEVERFFATKYTPTIPKPLPTNGYGEVGTQKVRFSGGAATLTADPGNTGTITVETGETTAVLSAGESTLVNGNSLLVGSEDGQKYSFEA